MASTIGYDIFTCAQMLT